MTVAEVITQLQKIPDQSKPLLVNVRVYTQAWGVAQCEVWQVAQNYGGATLEISLPNNMHVVKRKVKK